MLSDVETTILGEAPLVPKGDPVGRGMPEEPVMSIGFDPADVSAGHTQISTMTGPERRDEPTAESVAELGKAHGWRVRPENTVHVLEECITDDPGWGALTVSDRVPNVKDTTTTQLLDFTDDTDVHISRANGPRITPEREGNRNGGAARCVIP